MSRSHTESRYDEEAGAVESLIDEPAEYEQIEIRTDKNPNNACLVSDVTTSEKEESLIDEPVEYEQIEWKSTGVTGRDFKISSSGCLISPSAILEQQLPSMSSVSLKPQVEINKGDDKITEVGTGQPSPSISFDESSSSGQSEDQLMTPEATKKPLVTALKLPATEEPEKDDSDESGSDDDSPKAPKLTSMLTMAYGRTRARLQEPPPITPRFKEQILQRRRLSTSSMLREDIGTTPHKPPPKTPIQGTQTPTQGTSPRRKSFIPPIMSPSAIVPLIRRSLSISNQVPEEEDPLENDLLPDHKESKRKESLAWMITQWLSLLLLAALLICSIKIKKVQDVEWLGDKLWRWQALALVTFSGQLISGWVVQFFVLLIENHFIWKKKVLYFVYGLRKSVRNSIWLALVISVWQEIFEKQSDTKTVQTITRILWCLFTTCTSWMLKVLTVKVAANSFHRATYFDRIQDCLFSQYVLETLSAPPAMNTYADEGCNDGYQMDDRTPGKSPLGAKDRMQSATFEINWAAENTDPTKQKPMMARSASPIQPGKLQQLTSETVSARTLKSLMKSIRKTNMSTYSSLLSQGDGEIHSEEEAKAAAKKIFYNVARPGQKYLTLEDFFCFLPEDEATRAFALFEITEQGTVTKKALAKWVVGVYKERRALALTLNDNKTVVAKLHKVLDVVLAILLAIVCLLIMGVETSKLLVFFSSIFVPCVFIFGNSAKTTFEALIFLFVMHPFDVGDRVSIDGAMMLVEEMNVLNTVFLGGTNEKVYFPNSVLATKSITNYHRSPDQWDGIDFQIHMHTPLEKLGSLKDRIHKYIESQPQFWYPDFALVCKDIEDSTRMKMGLYFQHHLTYQDAGERFKRRSNMLLNMKQQLEDLDIGFHLPKQEILVTGLPVMDIARPFSATKML